MGAEFFHENGQVDRQTDLTKLIVAFRNIANASKNPPKKLFTSDKAYIRIHCTLHLQNNKFHLSNHSAINFLSACSEITELDHREYNKDTVRFLSSLFSHSVFVFFTFLAPLQHLPRKVIKTKDISTEKFGRSIHCRGFSLSPRSRLTLLSVTLCSALATSLVCLIKLSSS